MGSDKSLLLFEGRTLLERAIAAAGGRRTALVTSAAVAPLLTPAANVVTIVNDAPERGMAHSLKLADAELAPAAAPLVVLLVDTPLIDAALVDRIVQALGDADVAYPVCGRRRGHPVVFGPRARARIRRLPQGDTLRTLRDDPALTRREVAVAGEAPFLDVDTGDDFRRLLAGELWTRR